MERLQSASQRHGRRRVWIRLLSIATACLHLVSPAAPRAAQPTEDPGQTVAVDQPQAEAASLKREAEAVARELAEAYPDDALTHALLGSAAYNAGRSEEAAKHLRRCLELNPRQVDAYEILAQIAYERGELEETVRLCREALRHGPAPPEILNRLGRALTDQGQADEAIRVFLEAVRAPKPVVESFYLLGQAHQQAGNHAEAKKAFQQAIALMPNHTQAFFGLYTACLRLGETEEAGRYREQFLKMEAADRQALADRNAREEALTGLPLVRRTAARTFFGAGQIHRVHQQAEKAAELYRKAADLDPDNPMYRAALEAYYVQRKALPEGVKVFRQLVAEQPENSLNYFFLGRLLNRLDQFEAAEKALEKVRELAPEWPEGHQALAELYLRTGRKLSEAQALARRVVELEPTGANYYLLAVASLKTGDRAGAIDAMKQAVALSPGEARYREFLRRLTEAP